MEETRLAQAIILRNRPFKERDSQLELYTKEFGRLSLIARGTKDKNSKFAGHIEPLTLADVMIIRGRKIDYLGAIVPANSFLNIKRDLDKILIATRAIKIFLDQVQPDKPEEELYILLKEYFEFLEDIKEFDPELFLHFFILKLMAQLGFTPELYHSLENNEKVIEDRHFFDFARGGLVSQKTSANCLTISSDCIKIMRIILRLDFLELKKIKIKESLIKELINIIDQFYIYNLSKY